MTQQEAVELAAKRERHKPKSMRHKRWSAVHNSVKGWHVALVDDQFHVAMIAEQDARSAFLRGDLAGFMEAGSRAVMAKVQAAIDRST